MLRFVLKRVLIIIPTLVLVTFILFYVTSLTPSSPAQIMLGTQTTPEAIAKLDHELGYDRPFMVRFLTYVRDIVLHGDFGKSYISGRPVFDEIFPRFPTTLTIALLATVVITFVGVPLGILSAVKQYSVIDFSLTTLALLMASAPAFWVGLLLMLTFGLKLGWLPASGIGTWKNYVLPTLTISMSGTASVVRLTRTTMLEAIRQDYIRTARAKGAPKRSVIFKHALKNALLPVITSLSMNFAGMLGGTVVTESVFALPGVGTCILNAIRAKDIPIVMGATLFLATMFCLIMLLTDILYGFIDPRLRARYTK